ncbi:hypothetical protein AEAC466_04515 [Asticcacaulis sp. AC466]|uniref:hypothetical protein n=1 Tax=Asticcacaulis sp. AC466 TaxID=1282362 RepID=UPI0003C3DE0F|nr:hypothetical protein [Asticcacaulis sp. AC466]ESQ85432.1 hypothetical protein AEAC466_04515 [Asticcacaulis sp. AC466]
MKTLSVAKAKDRAIMGKVKLTPVSKVESFVVIMRAMGGDDQRAALAELHARGLWLGDGSYSGHDQQSAAIRAAGHPVPSEKQERNVTLAAMGYCSPKAQQFIDLYVADVKRTPDAYDASVRNWPEHAAARIIENLTHDEIDILIKDAKAEARLLARHGH